ncbi:MAG: hypothetical protein HQL21_00135 [Candidatus Omnitrophica bacterium]|nr:hypothetical protein [Candidatus Omnitrophota bacterium]
MVVEIFSLCDAATSENGKLNLLGAFDTIWVKQFPAVYPHCTVAIRIRFSSLEAGSHRLDVRFMDEDGKNILPTAGGPLQITMPEGQRSVSTNLILNIQSLKLERPGEASLELSIDGQLIVSLSLFVKQIPSPTS